MSTKKKPTKKEEAIPSDIKYQDMFTTDPEKIRAYIAASPRYAATLDQDTILKINVKAHKRLTQLDFMVYLNSLDKDAYLMMLQFQNIVDPDPRITKILRKKYPSEEEESYLMNWRSTNYSDFRLEQEDSENSDDFDEK
jgi:hypothetical protein